MQGYKDIISLLPSHCDCCPLSCGANRKDGQIGLCGANDKLYIAKAYLHKWEEPPISCEHGSGTIFFNNCSMQCVYCQNYLISRPSTNVLKSSSINDLVTSMKNLESAGACNINIVTGSHYVDLIIEAIRQGKLSIPVVWNTSGYETEKTISKLQNHVDVWLTDFKYAEDFLAKKYSQNNICNYVEIAMDALKKMFEKHRQVEYDNFDGCKRMRRGIIVRHLLLPNNLDNSKKALKLLYEYFGNHIKYSIMNQYTPVIAYDTNLRKKFPELCNPPSNDEYEELLDFADKLVIKDYFWQEGGACCDSFIPDFCSED